MPNHRDRRVYKVYFTIEGPPDPFEKIMQRWQDGVLLVAADNGPQAVAHAHMYLTSQWPDRNHRIRQQSEGGLGSGTSSARRMPGLTHRGEKACVIFCHSVVRSEEYSKPDDYLVTPVRRIRLDDQ